MTGSSTGFFLARRRARFSSAFRFFSISLDRFSIVFRVPAMMILHRRKTEAKEQKLSEKTSVT